MSKKIIVDVQTGLSEIVEDDEFSVGESNIPKQSDSESIAALEDQINSLKQEIAISRKTSYETGAIQQELIELLIGGGYL